MLAGSCFLGFFFPGSCTLSGQVTVCTAAPRLEFLFVCHSPPLYSSARYLTIIIKAYPVQVQLFQVDITNAEQALKPN